MESFTSYAQISLILIGLILLIIGIIIGNYLSTNRETGKKKRNLYLKEFSHILSDEPEEAIEEFLRASEINSENVEIYLAFGNLLRNKGNIEKAIKIHENILARSDIDKGDRVQAMYDLSLDFKKAGFIEKAIISFEKVIKMDPNMLNSYIQLENLYEEIKEWEKAYNVEKEIIRLKKGRKYNVLAHFETERAKEFLSKGDIKKAKNLFKRAISLDKNCIDAYLHLGDLYFSERSYNKAIYTWNKVMKINPSLFYLTYNRLEEAYLNLNKLGSLEKILRENSLKSKNDVHTHLALARYLYKKGEIEEAIKELEIVLEISPGFIEARKELGRILIEKGDISEIIDAFKEFLDSMEVYKKAFQCKNCGYEMNEIRWKCPQCLKWDTILPIEKG
jgi:lipopolysaccharide biosynthesis regulator YciM